MAEITKVALKVDNNNSFPNNNAGAITPTILRSFNVNMIDSLVDEIPFGSFTSSVNTSLNALNVFTASATGLTTGSLLITASAAGNVITFTKGNNTTFNVTVATGSVVDISNLNQATASLQAFTASAQVSINNLNTTTASLNSSVTQLNANTASQQVSINALNVTSASQQVSIDSINAKTGSFATTGSNTFVSANTFTSISASSFISASQFVGDGSKITNITASIALPILDEGIPQGNAFSMNFTGSAISAIVVGGTAVVSVNVPDTGSFNSLTASFNAYTASTNSSITQLNANTASQQVSIDNLNLYTSSFNVNTLVSTASFNSYTSSNNQRVSSLEVNSASVNTSISALNTYTASQSTASLVTSITNLNTFSASALVSISNINSTTASLNTSVTNLNSATASLFTSASLALVTASFDTGTRNLTFTKGDTTTFAVNIPDVSGSAGTFVTTSSFNAYTQSNDQKVDSLIAATGSYATTGSNSFNGNQIITGSVYISSSATVDLRVEGQIFVSSSATGGTTAPKITVSGSAGTTTINRNSISTRNLTNSAALNPLATFATVLATNDEIGISVDPVAGGVSGWTTGPTIYINNTALDTYPAVFGFQNKANLTDGRVAVLTPLSASAGFTASLQNGYAWVGNSLGQNTQVLTSSFAGATINTGSFVTTSSFNAYTASVTQSIVTATVTNNGSNYYLIDGIQAPKLSFVPGPTYRFDLSGIVGSHPFKFSTTANGPTEYTTGVTSGSNFIQIEVGYDTTTPLYYYCTNHNGMGNEINVLGIEKLVTTASFNAYTASQSTGSLVTSITSLNTFTSSVVLLNANNIITGSQIMSGSLTITGSAFGNVVALSITSNTASMDLSRGNYFTLTLADTATTHISASNVQPGTSATLVITTGTNSSASLAPTMLQPSGSAYSATNGSSKKDILSIVSVSTGVPFVVSTKNMI